METMIFIGMVQLRGNPSPFFGNLVCQINVKHTSTASHLFLRLIKSIKKKSSLSVHKKAVWISRYSWLCLAWHCLLVDDQHESTRRVDAETVHWMAPRLALFCHWSCLNSDAMNGANQSERIVLEPDLVFALWSNAQRWRNGELETVKEDNQDPISFRRSLSGALS